MLPCSAAPWMFHVSRLRHKQRHAATEYLSIVTPLLSQYERMDVFTRNFANITRSSHSNITDASLLSGFAVFRSRISISPYRIKIPCLGDYRTCPIPQSAVLGGKSNGRKKSRPNSCGSTHFGGCRVSHVCAPYGPR